MMKIICLYFLWCILCMHYCFSLPLVESNNLLVNIEGACPSLLKNFLSNSTYLAKCKNIEVNLKDKNLPKSTDLLKYDLVTCVTIYAAMHEICRLDSIKDVNAENIIKFPVNNAEFDSKLNEMKPKTRKQFHESINGICTNITSLFQKLNSTSFQADPSYIYVKSASDMFNPLIQGSCSESCIDHDNIIDPRCIIFVWANTVLERQISVHDKNKEISEAHKINKEISVIEKIQQNPSLVSIGNNKPPVKETPKKKQSVANLNSVNVVKPPPNEVVKPVDNDEKIVDSPKDKSLDEILKKGNEKIPEDLVPQEKKKIDPSIDEDLPIAAAPRPQENPADNVQIEEDNPDEEFPVEDPARIKEEETLNELENEEKNRDLGRKSFPKNPVDQNLNLHQEIKNGYSTLEKEKDESHFVTYFSIIILCIGLYIVYHNKQKILAILLEGRRGSRRGRGSRRRPSTANYRKLDCNLEEAVTSQCNSNATPVIY